MSLCKVSTVEIKEEPNKENTEETPSLDIEGSDVTKAKGGNTNAPYKGNWDYNGNSGQRLSSYDDLFKKAAREIGIDWKLVAAHSYHESKWKPNVKSSAGAGGLFQIIPSTWRTCAPNGYESAENTFKPEIAVMGYINLMKHTLNKFKNANTRNDQILLTIQTYHDGTIHGTSWSKVMAGEGGNKYTYGREGICYVKNVFEHYGRFGGQIH